MDPVDPELLRAYQRQVSGEQVRCAYVSRLNQGNIGVPEEFVPLTDAQMWERARDEVRRSREWRESPDGRFFIAMDRCARLGRELAMEADQALSARSRSWLGELRNCDVRAQEVLRMAQELVSRAEAAIEAVDDEAKAQEKS